MSKNSQNWLSKTLLVVAAALLLGSLKLPYWRVRVIAPQYPKGLQVIAYANRSEGDVQEIDGLNHYIGMKRLEYAAQFERRFALPAMYTMCALLLAAGFVPRRWAIVLAVPAMLFPLVFAGDLYFWLRHYGLHLDPHAPIRLNPFVPPLFGTG
jgi:hypothetical protein